MKTSIAEKLVIAHVLKWGEQAARVVLPELTPDKFIDEDHQWVWKEIGRLFFKHGEVTVSRLMDSVAVEYMQEFEGLLEQYHIYEFDEVYFRELAEQVDKAGVIWNMSQSAYSLSQYAADEEAFEHLVQSVDDVDVWAAGQLDRLSYTLSAKTSGYTPIQPIADTMIYGWERIREGEKIRLLNTGFPSLTGANLLPLGKLVIMHGYSNSGKSTLAFQLAIGAALDLIVRDVPGCIAINSLEMEATELVERMAAILSGVDVSKFMNGTLTDEEYQELLKWVPVIKALPIYIDDSAYTTINSVYYRIKALNLSNPVKMLITDYAGLFADDRGSEEQHRSYVFTTQKRIAKENNCCVLAISQSTDSKENGKARISGGMGLRYSRQATMAADVVLEVYNPSAIEQLGVPVSPPEGLLEGVAYVLVQKYRGAQAGVKVPLGWEPSRTTFWDHQLNAGFSDLVVFHHLKRALEKLGMSDVISEQNPGKNSW